MHLAEGHDRDGIFLNGVQDDFSGKNQHGTDQVSSSSLPTGISRTYLRPSLISNSSPSLRSSWAKFDNTGQRPVSIEWGRGISKLDTPVIRGALAALNRAAEDARRTAIQTGTELIIMRNGEICSLSHEEIRSD